MMEIEMRYKKVLFIIPNLKGFYGWPPYPHTGVGYISTFLEAHGVEYELIDMNLGYEVKDLMTKIKHFEPELIAMTLYTYKHSRTYELIAQIRGNFDIPVAAGIGKPINKEALMFGFEGENILDGNEGKKKPEKINAVNLIIEKVLNSPGEITIITLGAVSNVAGALLLEPSISKKIKKY